MEERAKSVPMEIKVVERRIQHLKRKKTRHEMMTTKRRHDEDLKDTKKHAKEIKSLDSKIEFMKRKRKCMMIATKNSMDMKAAQKLLEQEELEAAQKEKIKRKLMEQEPTGESSPDFTNTEASPLPPLTPRYPPCPKGCDLEDYDAWAQEYDIIQELNAARNNLPTQSSGHKDPATVAAVVRAHDIKKLLRVADAVVNVSYPCLDPTYYRDQEDLNGYCTGLIISWDKANKRARILTCDYFGDYFDCTEADTNRKLYVRWQYMEDTVFEAEVLFSSTHYEIALLEIAFLEIPVDIPLDIPSFGSSPKYGLDVFALARDKELSLMVRRGTIMWQQECLDELRQGYLFVDYELPDVAQEDR